MFKLNQSEVNKVIQEAVQVSLSLYDQVDCYKLETDAKVKYLALGQCLRSIVDILENEPRNTDPTT